MRKKYLFPFEKEKRNIPWKKIAMTILISYAMFLILAFAIIKSSKEDSQRTLDAFYQHSPQLIVVPTGDYGRIKSAIQLAIKFKLSNIFITGVYEKNSIRNILPREEQGKINLNMLEIDYWARNTVENVISTIRYLRINSEVKNVLIVSSDYHISRIKLIFKHLRTDKESYRIYFYGQPHDYSKINEIIKLHKEVFKLIRSWIFLMLWTPETTG